MKRLFILVLLLFNLTSCLHMKTASTQKKNMTSDNISFIGIVDIDNATKDGVYMNGYVVEIDYDRLKILNGKKVKITGIATNIKGLEKSSKEEDTGIQKQGRLQNVLHIKSPTIEIISN